MEASEIVSEKTSVKTSEIELKNDKIRLNDTQVKILKNIAENKYLSAAKLAEITGISKRNVENNIKKLKEAGILIRHGSPKSGYWEKVE